MLWLLWAVVLVGYEASTTFLARAVNSGSLWYHAIAALVANAFYAGRYIFLLESGLKVLQSGSLADIVLPALFFVVCTVTGSVGGHYAAMRWVERGNRRVGALSCGG